MVKAFQLIFCIFLTSSFAGLVQTAKADYCFENTNKSGVMPTSICFKEVKVIKPGTPDMKVYLKSKDVDDIYYIKKSNKISGGHAVTIQGDYINYSANCGLTILSQFNFNMILDESYQYTHAPANSLVIKYQYSPNNCQTKVSQGSEHFVPTAR